MEFEWDEAKFPDPKAMLSRLKQRGVNICVWINSYISEFSKLFDEGRKAVQAVIADFDRRAVGAFRSPDTVARSQRQPQRAARPDAGLARIVVGDDRLG